MHSPFRQGPPPLGALRNMRYRDFYPLANASVPHARHDFRARAFTSMLPSQIAESAELCLSELASNAVRHAEDKRDRRWFHVSSNVLGRHRRFLQIGVHDIDAAHIPDLPTVPVDPLAAFDDESETGRGLLLVSQLADGIGVEYGPGHRGKTVWCRFYLPSPPTLLQRFVPLARIPAYPAH